MRPLPLVIWTCFLIPRLAAQDSAVPDFSAVIASTKLLASEITRDGTLPGVSIALVDGGRVVWADGFGVSDLERREPTTPRTIYRVGSISKLFTALAAMRLVEAGKLDIDRPLDSYLTTLGIANPFLAEAGPVTPRQIFAHASGLFREPPLGSYFDNTPPGSPARVLESVRGLRLVHPPGRVTKYSNAGVSILGSLVEHIAAEPYEAHMTKGLLEPMAMRSSGYRRTGEIARRVATGYMQQRDRRLTPAPTFELSTIAAGNLYSTVEDLAQLAILLHARGEIVGRRIISAETLERMWKPFLENGRFGIGFALANRDGERVVEHSGAVFGFSSVFACLPDAKLSVVLLANEDVGFGPLKRLTDRLLGGALAVKRGKPTGEDPALAVRPVDLEVFREATGVYRSDKARLELKVVGDEARLVWQGHPVRLLSTGPDAFIARDRLIDGNPLLFERESSQPGQVHGRVKSVRLDGNTFARLDPASAPIAPKEWAVLEGDYGPDYLPVRIRVREGRLVAECETFEYEPAPQPDGSFVFPKGTLYEDEALRFQQGADGRVTAITLGTMRFEPLRASASK